jgi:5-deoxy-glucuronate isomerase
MKIKKTKLKNGLNLLVKEEINMDMKMDFGILVMTKGETFKDKIDKECIYSLHNGEVRFNWEDKKKRTKRMSLFHEDPSLLHLSPSVAVEIVCLSDKAELSVHRTKNTKKFESRFLDEKSIVSASEVRGEGVIQDTSKRIVRTYIDRGLQKNSNFFIGEVVSFPGLWSSYPPHTHVTPEIYYYHFLPDGGFGLSEEGDGANKVHDGDLMCFPERMRHAQATAPGYAQWYLWVIRLREDENMQTNEEEQHLWTLVAGAKFFPDLLVG